jgi:hypothetical protein
VISICQAANGLDVLDGVPLPTLRDRSYQLCHPSEVLSDRCKRKLVPCAARTSQSKAPEPEDALQVREPHLDALALATRQLEGIGPGERSSDITSALINVARDLRCGVFGQHLGLRLQFAQSGTLLR